MINVPFTWSHMYLGELLNMSLVVEIAPTAAQWGTLHLLQDLCANHLLCGVCMRIVLCRGG